jgi:hypothetical protein
MSSNDAAQPSDAPAADSTSPQRGHSECFGRRHFGCRGYHRWGVFGGDAPSGWSFHGYGYGYGYGWGAPPVAEHFVEEDVDADADAEEEKKKKKTKKRNQKKKLRNL